MKVSAEEILSSRPRKMKISSFTLQNGWLTSVLLVFFQQLGLVCTKKFCWVRSKEMLQQFCAVSSGRKKARWRKSKLKCRRRNNEASSQQLLRLPDHGPEPTHCNELPHWRKKYIQLILVNSSKSKIMWTIHCMKLNSPKHRLNTKNRSRSGSSFLNTQCWSLWTFKHMQSFYWEWCWGWVTKTWQERAWTFQRRDQVYGEVMFV